MHMDKVGQGMLCSVPNVPLSQNIYYKCTRQTTTMLPVN